METFKLIYSLALPCLVGYQAQVLIKGTRRFSVPLTLAISFGLGFGILTQAMLIIGALNIGYTIFNISCFLFSLIIIFMILSKNKTPSPSQRSYYLEPNEEFRINLMQFFFILFGLLIITYYLSFSFWSALNIPIKEWDSIATCIYNAKIIYFDKSLKSFHYFAHATYPLHISMIAAWVSLVLDQWDDQIVKIFFPLTFLSFLIVYYEFLSFKTNRIWALLGVFFLFSSNLLCLHATIEYRDLPLMFYNCVAVIFLLLWKDEKEDSFLIFASLFSGFGTFIKQEGLAYFSIHFLIMLFILIFYKKDKTKKLGQLFKFLAPSLGIFFIFFFYKIIQNVPTTQYLNINLSSAFTRVPTVFTKFHFALFATANWNILWAFLYVSILFNIKKIVRDSTVHTLLIAILLFFGLLISLSIIIGNDFIIHSFDISRVILHFFPLCPLAIILLVYSPQKN